MRQTGRYETTTTLGETVKAFVPFDLPPSQPVIEVDGPRQALLERARGTLERLNLAGDMIPSIDWFVYAFVRKEAVLSSQIEGTQATLIDLFTTQLDENTPVTGDVEEVCNYLDALSTARTELSDPAGLPLSVRLLKKTHAQLMKGVRGEAKRPGMVRRSQNWIGGTRPGTAAFVPPPPHLVESCLSSLEVFIHTQDVALDPLIRIGLIHVQFETIHPFLDGNGRLGRLLITLLLQEYGLLDRPLLYLSLFLKRHRQLYYDKLSSVRTHGDWESWIDFFLEGIDVAGREAIECARSAFSLVSMHERQLLESQDATLTTVKALRLLPERPIVTTRALASWLDVSRPTASKCIASLERLGILNQIGQ